jgi:hypothetical protein
VKEPDVTTADIQPHRSKRKALSKRTRFDVFKRDGFQCQYCGRHPPEVTLHCDHIVAVAAEGTNDSDNLVTSCADCNLGKSDKSLNAIPESMKDKAARIAEAEAQIQGYLEASLKRRERIEEDSWAVASVLYGDIDSLRRDWFATIKRFVEKIGLPDTFAAAEIAEARGFSDDVSTFRYFCGICWKKVKGE